MSKTFTIFGATGKQGGSILRYVLSHPELSKTFKVRGVTRDPSKPNAQKLKELGAEVVAGDMNSADSVKEAIKGSWAVFGVTNFWEHSDAALETQHGKTIADAAVAVGAELLMFSTLPNASKVTDGKLTHIPHFDAKAKIEEYARTLPIKSAFFWPAGFMQGLQDQLGPRKNEQGTYTMANIWAPDSRIPWIDITDSGKFIAPILKNPDAFNGKRMYAAGGFYTPEYLASTLSKGTGKDVSYVQLPEEIMRSFLPPPVATEMVEMLQLMRDYQYFGQEGKGAEAEFADTLAALEDQPTSFEKFVAQNEWPSLA